MLKRELWRTTLVVMVSIGACLPMAAFAQPFVDPTAESIGTDVPGFGGAYVDETGVLHVWLRDPDDQLAALVARQYWAAYGFADGAHEVVAERAEFTLDELVSWAQALSGDFGTLSLSMLDVDERRNRVVAGVPTVDPDTVGRVQQALRERAIPRAAVLIEQAGPFKDGIAADPGTRRPGSTLLLGLALACLMTGIAVVVRRFWRKPAKAG